MINSRTGNCLWAGASITVYFLLYVMPLVIEATIVGLNYYTTAAVVTICICAILQSVISAYGGYDLMYSSTDVKGDCVCCTDKCDGADAIFCHDLLELRTILKGSYILYALPGWVLTNWICSWVNAKIIPVAIHLMVYVPLLAGALGSGTGYAAARRLKGEYIPV